MGRPALELIMWDFDGTIVDTDTPWKQQWLQHFQKLALHDFTHEEWAEIAKANACPSDVIRKRLKRELTKEEIRAVNKPVADAFAAAGFMQGVLPLMKAARQQGIRQALVTNGDAGWIQYVLQLVEPTMRRIDPEYPGEAGFREYFCDIQVKAGKPETFAVRSVLEKVGVEPENALAFDDAPWGIEAFNRVGVTAVHVPCDAYRHFVLPGVPRLETLDGVTLPDLQRLLPSQRAHTHDDVGASR